MVPKGSHKWKGKATATAKMPTSGINRHLSLDQERIMRFVWEYIRVFIQRNNFFGIKDERAWDLFHDIIFLHAVTTRHFSQLQIMWRHRRSRMSPFREWWAGFRSYMGQMFDKTSNQMNHWSWDNPHAFGDQVDHSKPLTSSLGKHTFDNTPHCLAL